MFAGLPGVDVVPLSLELVHQIRLLLARHIWDFLLWGVSSTMRLVWRRRATVGVSLLSLNISHWRGLR